MTVVQHAGEAVSFGVATAIDQLVSEAAELRRQQTQRMFSGAFQTARSRVRANAGKASLPYPVRVALQHEAERAAKKAQRKQGK